MNVTSTEKLEDLKKQVKELVTYFESDVRSNQRIFAQYKSIVETNDAIGLQKGARFHLWVERNHYYALYAGLRKMFFNRDSRETSLLTIIEDLLDGKVTITKNDYAEYLGIDTTDTIQNEMLESVCGHFFEACEHLSWGKLSEDKALILKIKKSLKFINESVLHIQKNREALRPTSKELKEQIETLARLLKEYELFLVGSHIAWTIPNLVWVDIFTQPWINQDAEY